MVPLCLPSWDPGMSQDLLSVNHPAQACGFPSVLLLSLSLICPDSDPSSLTLSPQFSQLTFYKPSHATSLFDASGRRGSQVQTDYLGIHEVGHTWSLGFSSASSSVPPLLPYRSYEEGLLTLSQTLHAASHWPFAPPCPSV